MCKPAIEGGDASTVWRIWCKGTPDRLMAFGKPESLDGCKRVGIENQQRPLMHVKDLAAIVRP